MVTQVLKVSWPASITAFLERSCGKSACWILFTSHISYILAELLQIVAFVDHNENKVTIALQCSGSRSGAV